MRPDWRDRSWLQYANLHTVHELPTTHPDALVTITEAKDMSKGTRAARSLDTSVRRGSLPVARDGNGSLIRNERGEPLHLLRTVATQVT
ncbi:hypothetical protein [Actinotalea subterranea]|uniref:hypothetical protein n=1 Tax=Actinotalea subterranea TaxID=2607497 RepID=UPI0011ECCC26|nr:hypothetical protein [Actinotalea subterranea]